MGKDKEELKKDCTCGEACDCGDNCTCEDTCTCGDDCSCKESDKCNDGCDCNSGPNFSCEGGSCGVNLGEVNYFDIAQRLQADFDNYKRRSLEAQKQSYSNGVMALAEGLLPALDSFKQAKNTITDSSALSGLELIYNQIIVGLSKFNIKQIDCVNKQFDPSYHNAVLTDCVDGVEDEIILEELQAGFMLNDKVIRHSVVKINKK